MVCKYTYIYICTGMIFVFTFRAFYRCRSPILVVSSAQRERRKGFLFRIFEITMPRRHLSGGRASCTTSTWGRQGGRAFVRWQAGEAVFLFLFLFFYIFAFCSCSCICEEKNATSAALRTDWLTCGLQQYMMRVFLVLRPCALREPKHAHLVV